MKIITRTAALFLAMLMLLSVCACGISDIIDDIEDLEDAINKNSASTTRPEDSEVTLPTEITTDVLTDAATEEVTTEEVTTEEVTTEEVTTEEVTTETATDTTEVIVVPPAVDIYDNNGYLMDSIPYTLNYDETVSILCWSDSERSEFEIFESDVGINLVDDAIYYRNEATENRLGITLKWDSIRGSNTNRKTFAAYVQNCYSAGVLHDIIATYSKTSAILSINGFLEDLNTIENNYINTDKPWWPASMIETCSIDDSLFFVSGDISTNLLHFMYAIYYNKDLINDLRLQDPITFVDSKTWTLDKLIEMSNNLYRDNDASGTPTEGDSYGFCSTYFHLDAFYTGSGMKLVDCDHNSILKISDDFDSQKSVDLVDKLSTWFNQGDCFVSRSSENFDEDKPFFEGNALFIQNRFYLADSQYRGGGLSSTGWEYGILPTPLYDSNQKEYITLVANPYTSWSVMKDARDPSMSSAVIECLASEAYRKTSPAIFENALRYRYTPNSEDKSDPVRMFDIIRENVTFDLGRIFGNDLSNMSEIPSNAAANRTNWETLSKQQKAILEKVMSNLNKSLEKVIN